jgi:hypothetical protein
LMPVLSHYLNQPLVYSVLCIIATFSYMHVSDKYQSTADL